MKKKTLSRLFSLSMVGAMTVGLLAGCGGKNSSSKSKEDEGTGHFYNVSYAEDLPASFLNLSDASLCKMVGDTLYYEGNNSDYTQIGIYSYNITSGETATYYMMDQEDDCSGSAYISSFDVDPDGNVVLFLDEYKPTEESLNADYSNATLDDVLNYMVENWEEDEDIAAEEWADYYSEDYTDEDGNVNYGQFMQDYGTEYDEFYDLIKVDSSGEEIFNQTLELKGDSDTDTYYSVGQMAVDNDGRIVLLINQWDDENDLYYFNIYDADGNFLSNLETDSGWIESVKKLADGSVAYVYYGDNGEVLVPMDLSNSTTGEEIALPSADGVATFSFVDDSTVLMVNNGMIQKANLEDGTTEDLASLLDYSISTSAVSYISQLSDGRILLITSTYVDEGSSNDIAFLTEVDESEVQKIEYIDMACMWLDSDVEEQVIEFNKKHDDIHIRVTQFSAQSDDWDDCLTAFNTAITTDTTYDLVAFNDFSQVKSFSAKGLLTDLYPLIEADEDLDKDDFIASVLTACEEDGQLVALPTSFGIETMVGKASDVGTTPGWTVSELNNLVASKPEGTQLLQYETKDDMLRTLMDVNYNSFIDSETSSCNFDNQDFVGLLELCNQFPEEYEDYDETESESELLSSGKLLFSQFYLYDFESMMLYKSLYNDEITMIGYPNSTGNGALLSMNYLYGITTNCQDTDAAWEFLREFYMPDNSTDTDDDYYYSGIGFSVRKDDFEKFCQAAMAHDYSNESYYMDDYEVELTNVTQEQVDMVSDVLNNTTAVSGATSDDIFNIISEEAAYYFNGEKTAKEAAANVQSRMEIYLSETN